VIFFVKVILFALFNAHISDIREHSLLDKTTEVYVAVGEKSNEDII